MICVDTYVYMGYTVFAVKEKEKIKEIIKMNTVTVNGKKFEIVESASDEVETTMVDGNAIEFVSGVAKDEKGSRYEIDWYLDVDADNLPEDAEKWVSDWDTANEAHLMED